MSQKKKMPFFKALLAYPLSVVFYLCFGLVLCVFHPLQWIALRFGYQAHKKVVDLLNFGLVACQYTLGNRVVFENNFDLPNDKPYIIVSNHQSTHDIAPLGWFFRKLHPKYVSKQELGKGIPSVSFNLKHGGSALIDRKDARQALSEIGKLGKNIEKNNWSAVIFPEGTRSRNGEPKRFSENGLKVLSKFSKSANIIPVTINNSWKLWEYGQFPMNIGVKVSVTVHEPVNPKEQEFSETLKIIEERVKGGIKL